METRLPKLSQVWHSLQSGATLQPQVWLWSTLCKLRLKLHLNWNPSILFTLQMTPSLWLCSHRKFKLLHLSVNYKMSVWPTLRVKHPQLALDSSKPWQLSHSCLKTTSLILVKRFTWPSVMLPTPHLLSKSTACASLLELKASMPLTNTRAPFHGLLSRVYSTSCKSTLEAQLPTVQKILTLSSSNLSTKSLKMVTSRCGFLLKLQFLTTLLVKVRVPRSKALGSPPVRSTVSSLLLERMT